MPNYTYAFQELDTVAEVEAAVVTMKSTLDTQPTLFCGVTNITPTDVADAWDVGDNLTDSEINALTSSSAGNYIVYSVYRGENTMPLTASEVITKVRQYRNEYGAMKKVDKYFEYTSTMEDQDDGNGGTIAMEVISMTEHNVTNEDMSGYV
jgi:hypothetical protein